MAFVMTPTTSKCFVGAKQATPARRAAPVVSLPKLSSNTTRSRRLATP